MPLLRSPSHPSRRVPGLGVAVVVAVVLLLVLAASLTIFLTLRRQSLAELPLPLVDEARAALRSAETRDAPALPATEAEALLATARQRVAAMEATLAHARSAPWPPQHAQDVTLAAREALFAARAVETAARDHQRRTVEAAGRELEGVEARLADPAAALPRFPADRALHTAVGRARLELSRGRTALAAGDGAAAALAAGRALEAAEEAERRLGEHTQRLDHPDLQRQWDRWVREALADSHRGPSVLVDKAGGRTYLLRNGRVAASFVSESGRSGLAPKRHAGDAATPEGRYRVAEKRDRGATIYHRALLLDYPNREDRERFAAARRAGRIPSGRGIGSLIEIHGDGGRGVNWTDGCVALANPDMDRLFAAVAVGTPVTLVGRAELPAAVLGSRSAR